MEVVRVGLALQGGRCAPPEDMKRTGNTDGLPREVEAAHELMRECDRALFMLGEPGVPEVRHRPRPHARLVGRIR